MHSISCAATQLQCCIVSDHQWARHQMHRLCGVHHALPLKPLPGRALKLPFHTAAVSATQLLFQCAIQPAPPPLLRGALLLGELRSPLVLRLAEAAQDRHRIERLQQGVGPIPTPAWVGMLAQQHCLLPIMLTAMMMQVGYRWDQYRPQADPSGPRGELQHQHKEPNPASNHVAAMHSALWRYQLLPL